MIGALGAALLAMPCNFNPLKRKVKKMAQFKNFFCDQSGIISVGALYRGVCRPVTEMG
jgi:hypothetical protein